VEIYLDKKAVQQIRMSAAEAIEEGDVETLKEDIFEAFPEDRVETLEQLLGGGDFMDVVGSLLDNWSGDDLDELFELLETQLAGHGVDLKYHVSDDESAPDDEDEYEGYDEAESGDLDDDL
jgi:hypothetical protein